MKIYLSILACLLLSCTNAKQKRPENILPPKLFGTILKEIHLAEAYFEIYKNKNIDSASLKLNNDYLTIYRKNKISEKDFKKSLNYYSAKPKDLEKIYTSILEKLNQEKSKLDQK